MKRFLTLFLSLSLIVINAFAVEYEIVNTVSVGWYKSYIVNYRSVNADMTGTETVSGVLTLPAYGTPVCLLLDNHHTITQNVNVPFTTLPISSRPRTFAAVLPKPKKYGNRFKDVSGGSIPL